MSEDRPIRVLSCSQGFPRHLHDFHATFILDHARALLAAGAEVDVLCPAGAGLPDEEHYDTDQGRVAVHRFRYAPRRYETLAYTGGMHHRAKSPAALVLPLFFLGYLVAMVRRARRADVIHAHWWLPSGLVGIVAGRLTNTPVVVQIHGTDQAIAKGPLAALAALVCRFADGVVCVSDDLAAWVRRIARVEADVLPMPLRPSLAAALEHPTPPPADGPVFACGRLVTEKGFDTLIRAVARAGVPLVHAGDGGLRSELEVLAARLGADVTFLGPVAPDDLAAHYRAARIVAVPSNREGFGLVAAEALACGRAVVASDVGGLPQVVADGVTGVLVPPGDPEALAAALTSVDPALGAAGPASVAWIAPAAIGAATVARYRSILS